MKGLNSVGPGSWQAMGCMGTQGSVRLDHPHTRYKNGENLQDNLNCFLPKINEKMGSGPHSRL